MKYLKAVPPLISEADAWGHKEKKSQVKNKIMYYLR
jgi:hypothetical protein